MDTGKEYDQSGRYEIRIKGELAVTWSAWFDEFEIRIEKENTVLLGEVADQAALHGLLNKIRDIGLSIVSIQQVADNE